MDDFCPIFYVYNKFKYDLFGVNYAEVNIDNYHT